MDIRQTLQAASRDPRFQQALQAAQAELSDASPEQIDELIQLFEFAIEHPEQYPQVRQSVIADGMISPEDMPEQFDPIIFASILVVLYKLREGGGQQAFAQGGLARMRTLARQGRHGDTMLAHISPEEAALLKARGGAGTINPSTGLPQYFSLGKLFKAVAPIAAMFVAPYLAPMLGGSMLAAGAVAGGLGSALTGGNALKGAALGALGGGLGSSVGGWANEALGTGLSSAGQNVLGSGLVGGLTGAATGQGFVQGVLQGAAGASLGQAVGSMGGEGFQTAGRTFGNAMAAGYDPKSAAMMGGLSGLAAGTFGRPGAPDATIGKAPVAPAGYGAEDLGSGLSPSDAAIEGLKTSASGSPGDFSRFGTTNYLTGEQGLIPGQAPELFGSQPGGEGLRAPAQNPLSAIGTSQSPLNAPAKGGVFGTGVSPTQALALASVAGSLGAAPQNVQAAVKQMSPEQQEYFNRPSVTFDWNRMQRDAAAAGMGLSQYMAQAWPQITGGAYNQTVPRLARGGALSAVANLARGAGSGRDDTIDARLSDGEYVMDAETVAMLGDGSTDEGARRLDSMRAQLRKHKGANLSKGKISPNAKSPLAYLKGAA